MVTINTNELGAVVAVMYSDVYGVDRWQQGTSKHHEKTSSGQNEKDWGESTRVWNEKQKTEK